MKKILMTLALLCTLAQGAWADDVNYIYYTVNSDGKTITKHEDGSQADPTVLTSTLLKNSNEDNLNTGWYVLNSSFSYAERIVISGDVKLILKDGCTLTAKQGIRINTDATLTIYAQSETVGTMGKLVATETHHDKAAIGGNKNWEAGRLFIHGGEIEAKCESGSKYAAGIGGGYGDGSGMKEITIYGGKVTAQGAKYGAGIGGGKNNNHPGTINIYGGTVNAQGGEKSAGIGGGENRNGWTTNVYGGNTTAQGGYCGAGIGGGKSGNGGNLHFYGGTVDANAGWYAAGIGGGEEGYGGTITIDGGTIKATGHGGGTGIGGGEKGSAGTITINGGTVTSTACSYATTGYNESGGYDYHEEYSIYQTPAMMGYGLGGKKEGTVTIGNGATVHLSTAKEEENQEDQNATGIGCASLTLGSYIMVIAEAYNAGAITESPGQRVNTCMNKYHTLEIMPCTHDLHYTVTAETHTAQCNRCEYTFSEAHSIAASSTTCEVCGYRTGVSLSTLSFYQTETESTTGYMTSGTQYVQWKAIALPDCTQVPDGMTFVGWLKQDDTPTSIEAADSETLLQPGEKFTVEGNETFFARYRHVFTETWQWWIGAGNDQVAVTVNNGSGPHLIYATVTSKSVEATETTPGYTVYTAAATYKPNNTTYTFTDTRTVVDYTPVELVLDETDNTTKLADKDGAVANVTLTGRTLYKNGNWNTLCLPFDVEDISSSPLAGATVKELYDASFESSKGELTLTFADATSIEAGRAYLVKWDKADGYDSASEDTRDIKAPEFTGVTLSNTLYDDAISLDDNGTATVTFMGTYKQLSFNADDRTVLFLGANNTLYYPQREATIGAQRAYFKLSGITAGEKADGVRAFVLNFGNGGNATGIIEVEANSSLFTHHSSLKEGWYSLDGRKLSSKPTQRGIYINNGKKVVIK